MEKIERQAIVDALDKMIEAQMPHLQDMPRDYYDGFLDGGYALVAYMIDGAIV